MPGSGLMVQWKKKKSRQRARKMFRDASVLTCKRTMGENVIAVSQLLDLGRKGHARLLDMEVPRNLPGRCEP